MKITKLLFLILTINFTANSMIRFTRLSRANICSARLVNSYITNKSRLLNVNNINNNNFDNFKLYKVKEGLAEFCKKNEYLNDEDYELLNNYLNLIRTIKQNNVSLFQNFTYLAFKQNDKMMQFHLKFMDESYSVETKQTLKLDNYEIIWHWDHSRSNLNKKNSIKQLVELDDQFVQMMQLYQKIREKRLNRTAYFAANNYY